MNESGESKPGEIFFELMNGMLSKAEENATRHERSHIRGHNRNADEMNRQMGANAILQTLGFGYDSSHYGFFKGEFVSGGKVERDEYMKDYLDTLDKAKQAWEDVLNECIAASGNRVKGQDLPAVIRRVS